MSSRTRLVAAARPEIEPDPSVPVNAGDSPLSESGMEAGSQPIDAFMLRRGLSNTDLVAAAAGTGLTHKQVAKARRGRRLTMNLQDKILAALNRLPGQEPPLRREDCFNYRGR
ncbi:MAG TPA: hypothetical protein PKE12_10050 [Kiritimatiellia bacterium]|nr:hypothetical protein [Kiritimatiellia bacterium]